MSRVYVRATLMPAVLAAAGLAPTARNSKPNADELLDRVREHIAATFPDTEFVLRSKPTAAKPMVPEVFADLTACDAVVNAFGD
jgi:hypothetical protein